MKNKLLIDLEQLISEGRNPETMDLDLLSTQALVECINRQDKQVPLAVEKVLPAVVQAVDKIILAFKKGGRLIYMGAGTSGRLGVLDASECPPTFGVNHEMVIGIIAGGPKAILKAIEGAEDSPQLAIDDLKKINFNQNDILVGIAASGRTPYVIGALNYANSVAATTIALSCNPDSEIARLANIQISPVVGPEVLTGSTRMKSGSAQKLVLNMLSTASMIQQGKCYQNLMIDVKASNEKLIARALRIVIQATDCNEEEATIKLKESDYNVKLAILMILTDLNLTQAKQKLITKEGFLRLAIEQE
jgi:N-acetylmuramic acid 6-phosphate etherase